VAQNIGFIGVGPINSTLARFAVAAGMDVILSNSRGPETLTEKRAELGHHARAATVEEAAQASDIVVISIPLDLHDKLPSKAFAGKIVIDTMNYYPQRVGRIDVLEDRTLTCSEMVQRHLIDAHLVKAFYNLDFHHLANGPRSAGNPERSGASHCRRRRSRQGGGSEVHGCGRFRRRRLRHARRELPHLTSHSALRPSVRR
jgi:8-hydroxy-5-deazaflavin:NADPH oxidoreductase